MDFFKLSDRIFFFSNWIGMLLWSSLALKKEPRTKEVNIASLRRGCFAATFMLGIFGAFFTTLEVSFIAGYTLPYYMSVVLAAPAKCTIALWAGST